ncbi:lysylphosphatidylglycerol synthase transmembrane domain-containing protein [Ferruginibacter sp.]
MQKRLLSFIKYAFFLGLGIFLVWWSLHKMSEDNYQKFLTSLQTANYYLLIPVFFILAASHVSRAIRWKILMKSLGYAPKLSNTFCAVMVGYLANFAVPRLGEVLKCTILARYEKVPADKLVGTIIVERAVDVLSFLIVILISLLTQAHIVGEYAKNFFNTYILSKDTTMAAIKIAVIVIVLVAGFFTARYVFKKYSHIQFIQKLRGIFNNIIEGLLSIRNLPNKWSFIFHSVFIWACYLAGTYVGFFAIKETSVLPVLAAFPVLVFGTVATMITPGGIGSYPELVMKSMLLYSIPEAFGAANGWLQWSAQFIIILVMGFVCLLILPYLNKPKHEISTVNS